MLLTALCRAEPNEAHSHKESTLRSQSGAAMCCPGGEAARRDMAKDTGKPASGSQHCGQDDVA